MSSIAIVGAGAWGRALAVQARRAGAHVTIWARDPAKIDLPPDIRRTGQLPDTADVILLAIPAQHLRTVAARMRPRAPLLVCAKGIEAGTLAFPLEMIAEVHPGCPAAILTGPNFAAEITAGKPAAAVVAAHDATLRQTCIDLLTSPNFRLYGNDDPVGAQIGGAAKNVIAIGAGVVIGADLGENARAALVTRGLAELTRCVVALGGNAATVAGLSGLGDLLLTCTGPASRNFRFGLALGRGDTSADALAAANGVVEGVQTAPALVARALRARTTELPICHAVAELIAGQTTVAEALTALMTRKMRDE